jgi:hypothetical protein
MLRLASAFVLPWEVYATLSRWAMKSIDEHRSIREPGQVLRNGLIGRWHLGVSGQTSKKTTSQNSTATSDDAVRIRRERHFWGSAAGEEMTGCFVNSTPVTIAFRI